MADRKIPLPSFLKLLTSNGIPVARAMAIAGKTYKDYNTPASLRQLTDLRLQGLGVDGKDDRKMMLAALRKAGYGATGRKKLPEADGDGAGSSSAGVQANAATSGTPPRASVQGLPGTSPAQRKRKRDDGGDVNTLLPDGVDDEAAALGSLEFNEVLDVEVLKTKGTVINRAPLMTAWAMVVAQRIGFKKEEALSIATVYTEMNARSKGISLGIFEQDETKNVEASKDGTQPYVDLMGRNPLYRTRSGQWRALSSAAPANPSVAFSYVSRAFRQTAPYVLGALRLLGASFEPQELNDRGYGLYVEFRPEVDGWGARGDLRCETILALRKAPKPPEATLDAVGSTDEISRLVKPEEEPPPREHLRVMLGQVEDASVSEDRNINDLGGVDPDSKG